jgi:hypothetical protein
MSRLIIQAHGLDDAEAVRRVAIVMKDGLISNGTNGEQYCFASKFSDGVTVYANKTKSGTHSFRVIRSLGK